MDDAAITLRDAKYTVPLQEIYFYYIVEEK